MAEELFEVARRRKLWVCVLAALVTILTAVVVYQAMRKTATHSEGGDAIDVFDSYMILLPQFIHEHKPYTNDAFPLPPFAMLLITPFTALARPEARIAWILCKPVFGTAIFLILVSMVRRAGVKLEPWALVLMGVVWINPVMGDMQEGQMNLLMLLPLTLGLWCAQEETRGGDMRSGLLLAMAICIKVTPLAFLPYFLWRRKWGIVGWMLAGMAIWLIALPALFFGWDQNIAWLGQWLNVMILPYVLHSQIVYSNGESIPELLTRLLTHSPAWVAPNAAGKMVPHYMNIVELPDAVVRTLGRVLLVLVGGVGLWWARRTMTSLRSRHYVMEVSCVGIFMLWASERTWVHHYVTLLLALTAAAMIASDRLMSARSRKRAWAAMIAAAALIPWTSDLGKALGSDGRHYVESMDFVLIASVGLAAAIILAVADKAGDRPLFYGTARVGNDGPAEAARAKLPAVQLGN